MGNRKEFIKKAACLTGTCLCGFTSLVTASQTSVEVLKPGSEQDLMHEWISDLLNSVDQNADPDTCRTIMKACAGSHYRYLNMDNFLEPFIGKLDEFNSFIEKEWGWKISYKKDEGIIIADENKNICVCPMVNKNKGVKSSILCFCSEGFAELMFSKVAGHPVKAKVASSIHRGDSSCVYQINIS